MDVREKLVDIVCDATQINGCIHSCNHPSCAMVRGIVDALIVNGVTVQEWISVDDRLPDEPMRCLVYTKRGKYFGYEITYYNQGFYTQYAEAIYWMPLPQAPKGE